MILVRKKYWIEVVIHIAFWICIFYTLISLTSSTVKVHINQNGMTMERSEGNTISPYSMITLGFLILLFYGNIFWIFKKALRFKNSFGRFAVGGGWFILILLANYFIVGLLLSRQRSAMQPSQQLPGSGKAQLQTETTSLVVNQWLHMQITIILIFMSVLGISIAYFFLKEWAKNEFIKTQMEAHQLSTEIKFLKSQVNPHFLFNTLNNLFSMAQSKGNDELADGISKLSGMMRYMIYESNEEKVPLKKEIEYLENCIVLNKLRYAEDEIKLTFNYPENIEGLYIAPMLFIPFVENAFKHGVAIGQTSEIDISISLDTKRLIFCSKNTNHSLTKTIPIENSGIGLENVKRRLELVYPNEHELFIRNDGSKYNVNLEINLK
jgi:two-component system LytT family sensor kinase